MIRSADLMTSAILSDPALHEDVRKDPERVLLEQADLAVSRTDAPGDRFIYRIVVTALGLVVLIVIGGLIYLDHAEIEAPEGLVALGSTAVGTLAGLLSPTPSPR